LIRVTAAGVRVRGARSDISGLFFGGFTEAVICCVCSVVAEVAIHRGACIDTGIYLEELNTAVAVHRLNAFNNNAI